MGTRIDPEKIRFVYIHKKIFMLILYLTFMLQFLIIFIQPDLVLPLFWGALCAVSYIYPFPVLGKRLKLIPFFKTIYVPFVVISTLVMYSGVRHLTLMNWIVMIALYILILLNTVIVDIKDAEADKMAGIKTIANLMSTRKLLFLAVVICLVVAFLLMLTGHAGALALSLSFLSFALLCMHLRQEYRSFKTMLLADGVFIFPLLAYFIMGLLQDGQQ